MIIFDLEWNRSYDQKVLEEILQIGAVRVERLGGPVTDLFNVYVRPTVHKKFDPGAKSLPELQASRDSTINFAAAMELFRKWCGPEKNYAAWGNGDFQTLSQNCSYWNLPVLTAEEVVDVQHAFSTQVGTIQQVSLQRAAEYCGIPDVFEFHNALNDAMYTSIVASYLVPESYCIGIRRNIRKHLHFSELEFVPPPRQRIGPLPEAEDVLNDRVSRKPPCPVCGCPCSVSQWYYADGTQRYYSAFSCAEHGRFLCRLTLTRKENGVQGRRAVPRITPELIWEYMQALEGATYECKRRLYGKGRR